MASDQTEDEKLTARHEAAYARGSEDLHKRQLSNNENFDKGILTLASGGLALTVTFVGNLTTVHCITLLVLCWLAFVVAIVSTIVSYLVSQHAITIQLGLLEKYHNERDESARAARNRAAELNEHLAKVSAGGFIAGVLLLLIFFGVNATTENLGKNPAATAGPTTPSPAATVSVVVNPPANLTTTPAITVTNQAPLAPQGLSPQP